MATVSHGEALKQESLGRDTCYGKHNAGPEGIGTDSSSHRTKGASNSNTYGFHGVS